MAMWSRESKSSECENSQVSEEFGEALGLFKGGD